jgi:hypothetical protein
VRSAHGDARGQWCKSVGTFSGRLVAYRETERPRPVVNVFLDLHNVTGGANDDLFDLSGAKLTWTVTDQSGNVIEPNATASHRAAEPMQQKVLVKSKGRARLPLSQTDADVPPRESDGGAVHLTLAPGLSWSLEPGGGKTYFLSCEIKTKFVGDNTWGGVMVLPKVALPVD